MRVVVAIFAFVLMIQTESCLAELEDLGKVEFSGDIKHPDDISAVAVFGDGEYLVIGGHQDSNSKTVERR